MKQSIRILCASILAFAATGCATAPPRVELLPSPICVGEHECQLRWAAARSFVLSHAGYKFQTYTDDFMETYNPVGGAVELGARVNKEPIDGKTFKIVAVFWCDNVFRCYPNVAQTQNDFVMAVNAVHL